MTRIAFPVLIWILFFYGFAKGEIVLEIDIANPSSITISATSGLSGTDSTLNIGLDGITIENFFSSAVTYSSGTTFSGDLSPSLGTTLPYTGLGTFEFDDNDGTFKAGNDLSIFNGSSSGTQTFDTSTTAFTGTTSAIDFSSTLGQLPGIGTTGNVYSGYLQSGTADHGEVIGQWRVTAVPEPSSLALFAIAGISLWPRRKRKI